MFQQQLWSHNLLYWETFCAIHVPYVPKDKLFILMCIYEYCTSRPYNMACTILGDALLSKNGHLSWKCK